MRLPLPIRLLRRDDGLFCDRASEKRIVIVKRISPDFLILFLFKDFIFYNFV